MIKTEKEYQEAQKRLEEEFQQIKLTKKKMEDAGMNKEQIHLALDPLTSFSLQLKEEVEEYEKLKRGDFPNFENFYGIGRTLVSLRIFKGIQQKDLAAKLGVTSAQISRDERNEYHGASIEKIQKVLNGLDVSIKSKVDPGYPESLEA